MAHSLTIRESAGEFGIEIGIGGERFYAVIDAGFTHPRCEAGLCVERALYNRLAPVLTDPQTVQAYAVGSRPHLLRSGKALAEIVGLDDSTVETRILDGGSNLVGVCFFSKLRDYRVNWSPSRRQMRIWKR